MHDDDAVAAAACKAKTQLTDGVQRSTWPYSPSQTGRSKYGTVEYSGVQYSTVQYTLARVWRLAGHSTAQHSAVQHSTVQYTDTSLHSYCRYGSTTAHYSRLQSSTYVDYSI